jgi:S-adenosyl methyltransferase
VVQVKDRLSWAGKAAIVAASASRTAWREPGESAGRFVENRRVRHNRTVADELITDASDLTQAPSPYDTTVAHPARVYNYWLGGKDNFEADREVGEQTKAAYPDIVSGVQAQRAFLASAVRYLVTRAGVRQFLDIGTGLPVANNTHEVAQSLAPDLIPDADDPAGIVARLIAALPAGSWLAIAHPASDVAPDKVATMTDRYNQRVATTATLRTHAEISAFFAGTDLLPPGVVQYHQWHPGEPARDAEGEVAAYCGLGHKS